MKVFQLAQSCKAEFQAFEPHRKGLKISCESYGALVGFWVKKKKSFL